MELMEQSIRYAQIIFGILMPTAAMFVGMFSVLSLIMLIMVNIRTPVGGNSPDRQQIIIAAAVSAIPAMIILIAGIATVR